MMKIQDYRRHKNGYQRIKAKGKVHDEDVTAPAGSWHISGVEGKDQTKQDARRRREQQGVKNKMKVCMMNDCGVVGVRRCGLGFFLGRRVVT